jgi:hypothetical protein
MLQKLGRKIQALAEADPAILDRRKGGCLTTWAASGQGRGEGEGDGDAPNPPASSSENGPTHLVENRLGPLSIFPGFPPYLAAL